VRFISKNVDYLRDADGTIVGGIESFEDITERKKAEEELRKLSRAVEQSPAVIVITDTQGTIEFVNPRFTELTGYSAAEAIGKNPRILKSGQTPPEVFDDLWQTITTGGTWEGDVLNKSKEGTLFWEHSNISALRDAKGVITHYLAVKEDITEKKRITEQYIAAKEQAESASLAKSEFLATMSHEIRTPMNGVIGMTGLLLETDLTAEQREFAEIVRKSGENLLTIINEILDFSKIEAGKLDLEILDFDLRVALEDTAELLSFRASDSGLELICRIDPAVPSLLKGDPGRLRQIIINLVGNAIKFTRKGEVVISATLKEDRDGIATILFEIHDTGIGIPEARLAAIFDPFTQADGSTTRKFGGTGLGLSICKRLTELMGGEIGVTSVEGSGSTFWFTSRFEKQPQQTSEVLKTSEVSAKPDLAATRILVVDDNATNRKLMTALLTQWGCRHELAEDGQSGLELLREAAENGDPFGIALLDQEMPGMDGMELGGLIKADPLLAPTLLVMVTSLARRGDVAILEKIGFVGYLPKPVRQAQLYDCLELVLERVVETHCNASLPPHRNPPHGIITRHTVAESGRQVIRILLAEDNVINQKVAQHILKTLGYKADVAANGREAVRALELINYDLVLMDCQMPDMDGFEATAEIRDTDSKVLNHEVPIIAMTANAMQGDREKCLEAGMDDYLAKPVKKEEMAEIIQKWFMRGAHKITEN
jgi:PAS domain S-box-containing protein